LYHKSPAHLTVSVTTLLRYSYGNALAVLIHTNERTQIHTAMTPIAMVI
jgi:hypothetical protein